MSKVNYKKKLDEYAEYLDFVLLLALVLLLAGESLTIFMGNTTQLPPYFSFLTLQKSFPLRFSSEICAV